MFKQLYNAFRMVYSQRVYFTSNFTNTYYMHLKPTQNLLGLGQSLCAHLPFVK